MEHKVWFLLIYSSPRHGINLLNLFIQVIRKTPLSISETAYMDQIRNCVKFNKKFNVDRRRHQSFFDQQTGIAQRPNEYLIKTAADRHKPIRPTEVN